VRRKDFWRDEIEIAVPNKNRELKTVYRKIFYIPFNLFTVFGARLA
jgi:hypothetical protein